MKSSKKLEHGTDLDKLIEHSFAVGKYSPEASSSSFIVVGREVRFCKLCLKSLPEGHVFRICDECIKALSDEMNARRQKDEMEK